MRSRDELRQGCARVLRELREELGYSKAKMAELLYMDQHTWAKYETGQSVPSIIDFVYIFSACGKNALKPAMDVIFPYTNGEDPEAAKASIMRYIDEIATPQELITVAFLMFGKHGSNMHAQMSEVCMLNHLPMEYRYAIAQMVLTFYELAEKRGELVCTDSIMPDIDVFMDALTRGKAAAGDGRESYTILPE